MTNRSQNLQWNKKFAKGWNEHEGIFEKVKAEKLFEDFDKNLKSLNEMKRDKIALLKIKNPELLKRKIKEYISKWYGSGRTINVEATEKLIEECVKKGSFYE